MHAATYLAHEEFSKLMCDAWKGHERAMWVIAYRRARVRVQEMFGRFE